MLYFALKINTHIYIISNLLVHFRHVCNLHIIYERGERFYRNNHTLEIQFCAFNQESNYEGHNDLFKYWVSIVICIQLVKIQLSISITADMWITGSP